MRHRDTRIEQLTDVAEQLSADLAERERVAVEQERARITRELHDIVSHSISAVVIHAQAVRRRLDTAAHQRDIDDLRAMETTARHALAEMRRLLGMLRADGAPDSLAPQPGLAQLAGLLDDFKAAGLGVTLRIDGDPPALPPGVDLAAYRIIQEALTNVMRHAPGAATAVRVAFGNEHVSLCIENATAPGPSRSQDDGGHGLIGMRERISLYGGTFRAGPRPAGGFCVEACVPFRAGPD